jgi:uncharacterized membrane protein YoaK (UPF0700 family)
VLLLIGAAVAAIYGRRAASSDYAIGDAYAGMIAVVAMGVQNAIHRLAAPLGPTTTVMTSNVTQLIVIASRRILKGRPSPEKPPAPPFSLAGMTGLAVAFGAGCAISALLTLAFGLVSLAAPGILLIVISFWDRES